MGNCEGCVNGVCQCEIEEQDEDKIKTLEKKVKNLEERIAYIEYHSHKKREYRDPKVS